MVVCREISVESLLKNINNTLLMIEEYGEHLMEDDCEINYEEDYDDLIV